jgi:hypothetical protein
MPAEVRQFTDTMRHAPRYKPTEGRTSKPVFDTSGLTGIRW